MQVIGPYAYVTAVIDINIAIIIFIILLFSSNRVQLIQEFLYCLNIGRGTKMVLHGCKIYIDQIKQYKPWGLLN